MKIDVVEDETEKADCLRLRREVFIDEQGIAEADEMDGLDDRCLHILARCNGEAVGAARITYLEPVAKIQRVCVSRLWRGKGIGADIIKFAVDVISRTEAISIIRLGAQTHALDFYRKLGFHEIGAVYQDAGIPHRDMEISLNR
ncbi:GNAT family N-acetyltransferase [Algihabitans albus]|uniref:GNAT family N-acetyltransferase n=1 Tax=Algihabitans albus TaxID=2164067 RepID=UPI000E5CE23B|nr:GNAT family N-acetyltransferase [Algihabitans albus]